jgi:hypothetical protein
MQHHISWTGIVVVVALLSSGCATFHLTQEPFQPKGKRLAVIAGLTNPSSLQASQALADTIGRTSRFQVLSHKQVQAIPNYPQLIKGPYNSAYFEIDENYDKTDLGRVKELQKFLGVDYLYVLWAPASVQSGGKGWFFKNYPLLHVVAQVFEFPSGKEIGRGKYMLRIDDDRKELLQDDLMHIAKEFADKTRMSE